MFFCCKPSIKILVPPRKMLAWCWYSIISCSFKEGSNTFISKHKTFRIPIFPFYKRSYTKIINIKSSIIQILYFDQISNLRTVLLMYLAMEIYQQPWLAIKTLFCLVDSAMIFFICSNSFCIILSSTFDCWCVWIHPSSVNVVNYHVWSLLRVLNKCVKYYFGYLLCICVSKCNNFANLLLTAVFFPWVLTHSFIIFTPGLSFWYVGLSISIVWNSEDKVDIPSCIVHIFSTGATCYAS